MAETIAAGPIRWGILGTGRIAGAFAQALARLDDSELLAVGSRTPGGADAFRRRHGIERGYGSYAELAADPEIDVVYIASPHSAHREHALLCIEAGKPVLCEKPFALNAAEAREIVSAARARGLFCMEAMWTRFLPVMQQLRRAIADGAIGEPRMVSAQLGFPATPDPSSRLFDLAQGGGALLDLGVYPVALASGLLGAPVEVSSAATIGASGVDEQCALLLRYQDGAMATLGASLRNLDRNEAYIMGSAGQIRVHAPFLQSTRLTISSAKPPPPPGTDAGGLSLMARLRALPQAAALYRRVEPVAAPLRRRLRGGERTIAAPYGGNGLHYQAAEVQRCLRTGLPESPLMPLDETVAILETMDEARRQWGLVYPQELAGA